MDVPDCPLNICNEEHIAELERWVERISSGTYARIQSVWSDHTELGWILTSSHHCKDTPMPEYVTLLSLIKDLNEDLSNAKPLLLSRRAVVQLKKSHGVDTRAKYPE